MPQSIYGAGRAVWERLASTYLLRDLLPVVSNPDAPIDPESRMQGVGKTPSKYTDVRTVVGIGKWTSWVSDESDVARWKIEHDYGICIQTRDLRALDVDVDNPTLSGLVSDFIVERIVAMTGERPPVRLRANSGKLLIPVRCSGTLHKRRVKHRTSGAGLVELLATGQQFVAYGTHPSGVRYEWEGAPEFAPSLLPDELDELWAAVVAEFGEEGSEHRARESRSGSGVHRPDINDQVYQHLEAAGMVIDLDERKGHAHIVCPFEDEHSTHGLTSTTYMLAGSAGYPDGHFSCLHASCAHRHDGDYLREIGYHAAQFDEEESSDGGHNGHPLLDDVPSTLDAPSVLDILLPPLKPVGRRVKGQYRSNDGGDWPTFYRNKNGEIEATIDNVVRALGCASMSGAKIAFDEFQCKPLIDHGDGNYTRLTDTDYIALRISLEQRGFKSISQELMRHAVQYVAEQNTFNSARNWIDGLEWDGTPRVDTLVTRFYRASASDPDYARAVGRYLMTALAARILYPGCKVDMVPVLTSEQGTVKTSSIEALSPSPEMFGEMDLGMRDDDIARLLTGKVLVEMAELKGMKSREVEHLRSLITRKFEEWVPKYQENPVRRPRTCVFIATTNEHNMLVDTQGNRRWLPLVVEGQINVDGIRAARDQLWAEGAAIVRERVAAGLDPVEWEGAHRLGREKQAQHEAHDPLEEALDAWLESEWFEEGEDGAAGGTRGDHPFLIVDVLAGVGASAVRGMTSRIAANRIGELLRAKGYETRAVRHAKGQLDKGVRKRWVRKVTSERLL